jgi:SAM-dependent methyltransferase
MEASGDNRKMQKKRGDNSAPMKLSETAGTVAEHAEACGRALLFPEMRAAGDEENRSGFGDTAFTKNRYQPLHRWVPWIAGFSASFVEEVFDAAVSGDPGKVTVLDPFAGVGTTLVEGLKRGYNVVGFEINPYAALACEVKLACRRFRLQPLTCAIDEIEKRRQNRRAAEAQPKSKPPRDFKSKTAFFSPAVEREVLLVRDFIAGRKNTFVGKILKVALGAVMVGFSNYSYEPSLSTRSAAGRDGIETADVLKVFCRKLREMEADIGCLQQYMRRYKHRPAAAVHRRSYLDGSGLLAPSSIDLLVTSPPYLNNYHYVRNTRPQLFWLGLVSGSEDLKRLEEQNFGRFWQTVRGRAPIELAFELPELHEVLQHIRERNREKGAYGGAGWANYAAAYFNDCDRFFEVTRRVIKPGGRAVIVIGNNIVQGIHVETDRFLAQIAELHGFRLEGMHRVRKKRTGSSIVNSAVRAGTTQRPTELYETAVELSALPA